MFTGQPTIIAPASSDSWKPVDPMLVSALAEEVTPLLSLIGSPKTYQSVEPDKDFRWFDHGGTPRRGVYRHLWQNLGDDPKTVLSDMLSRIEREVILDITTRISDDSTIGVLKYDEHTTHHDILNMAVGKDLIVSGDVELLETLAKNHIGSEIVAPNHLKFRARKPIDVVHSPFLGEGRKLLLERRLIELALPRGFGLNVNQDTNQIAIMIGTKIWGTRFGTHTLLRPKGE